MRSSIPRQRIPRARIYTYREAGFFRMNVCGWRFVLIDTARHFAVYTDRTHGLHLGRFIVRLHQLHFWPWSKYQ